MIDAHRLTHAQYIECPNRDERPYAEVSLIVIHGISLPPGQFGGDEVPRLFCNSLETTGRLADLEGVRVSSHLYIRRNGEVIQFVDFNERAWHAGQSHFQGRENCNDFAVGIELEGTDHTPYTDEQYASLWPCCAELIRTYGIMRIVGHSDIAPGRKTDPGPAFDWRRLSRDLAAALN